MRRSSFSFFPELLSFLSSFLSFRLTSLLFPSPSNLPIPLAIPFSFPPIYPPLPPRYPPPFLLFFHFSFNFTRGVVTTPTSDVPFFTFCSQSGRPRGARRKVAHRMVFRFELATAKRGGALVWRTR